MVAGCDRIFSREAALLGKAAELAGLNRLMFMALLTRRGIVAFDYDEPAFATDLAGIAELVDRG